MTKSRIYDCYAYLVIDYPHNSYPIRHPENHLDSIFRLKVGDKIYIKGKGHLTIRNVLTIDYPYRDKGRDGLYQEIEIQCIS